MMSNLKWFSLSVYQYAKIQDGCWDVLSLIVAFLPYISPSVFRSQCVDPGASASESRRRSALKFLSPNWWMPRGWGRALLADQQLEDGRACGLRDQQQINIIWRIVYLCCFHEKFLGHVRTSLQLRRFVRWTQRFPVAAAAVVVLLGCSISLLPGKPQGLVHWHWLNGMLYETRLCPLSGSKWYHETLRDSKGWLGCSSIKSLQHRLIPWNP